MRIGTKSLLFGAHQFVLHPFFLAIAWRKLYGSFPTDPRIWLAFVVHDWGYWGCPNMDGDEGKLHPWRAARWFTSWFDRRVPVLDSETVNPGEFFEAHGIRAVMDSRTGLEAEVLGPWGRFCLFHSRSLARRYGEDVSPLCAPDKIASFMMPRWIYLTGTRWSGELAEYMAEGDTAAGRAVGVDVSSAEAWFESVKAHLDTLAVKIVAGGDPGIPPTRSETGRSCEKC